MSEEIGNKTALRALADALKMLSQKQTPADLETGKVQVVIDLGRFLAPADSPFVQIPLDAQILEGFTTIAPGAPAAALEGYLTSPDAENAPCMDIQTNIDTAYNWQAIDLKVDGWEAVLHGDLETNDRFGIEVFLTDHLDNYVCSVYKNNSHTFYAFDGVDYFFGMGVANDRDPTASIFAPPSTWDGFVPANHSLKIRAYTLDEGNTFGPAAALYIRAYGRAQLNNGNNGTIRVPRPLGIS